MEVFTGKDQLICGDTKLQKSERLNYWLTATHIFKIRTGMKSVSCIAYFIMIANLLDGKVFFTL